MKLYDFRSSIISNEINLNEIAGHFGINKKFKWEEPLILDERFLKGILSQPSEKIIYVFSFGSIVCVNMEFHEIKDIINYFKKIDKNLKNNTPSNFIEEFKLEVREDSEFELNYNFIILPSINNYHLDMLAIVLAKSVSLKKIEEDIDILLDEIEDIIGLLDRGHLNLSDEKLSKMSANILKFKYNTISYIMLLEKPKIAWNNEEAEAFFVNLSDLFELKDRYEKIRHKTEILLDITEVFTSLTHAKRGTKLEWMVIILILIEIIMSILEKIF
jgi:required for meiotic nuclear division protein 1